MINQYKIYLAGTIYNEYPGNIWKKKIIERINQFDKIVEFYDPDPKNESEIGIDVVPKDKKIIEQSDYLIAYMEKPTVGTVMEIKHAFDKQNIIVYVIDPLKIFTNDIWLKMHTHKIFNSIDDCSLHILKMI